jgi:Hydrolytic ATP binding site of dynein motor region
MLALDGTEVPGFEGPTPHPGAVMSLLERAERELESMAAVVRGPLVTLRRVVLSALLISGLHNRDMISALVSRCVRSTSDFEWTKNLRFHWDEQADDVIVRQTCASFQYGHEYLGSGARLVITPLTDAYYIALTDALHRKLGGAMMGQAGTGAYDINVAWTVITGIDNGEITLESILRLYIYSSHLHSSFLLPSPFLSYHSLPFSSFFILSLSFHSVVLHTSLSTIILLSYHFVPCTPLQARQKLYRSYRKH